VTASPLTVADLGERALIARIRARVPPAPAWVTVGIGDDAAVVEPERGTLDVVTIDALVEGVHFDRTSTHGRDLGFKALAVNLSDLAAMGAAPRLAVLSLALPPTLPVASVDDLIDGVIELANRAKTHLVGGNVTSSPGPLVMNVAAIGSVKRRKILTRRGACPADELWLSGSVGAAAAGLEWLQLQRTGTISGSSEMDDCRRRYLRPEPRTRLGMLLGRQRAARACIDLSDGLSDAVHQIAEASGVGAIIEAAAVPIDAQARAWFQSQKTDPVMAALQGGEDYELLFTVPRALRKRLAAVKRLIGTLPLTQIGEITSDRVIVLRRDGQDTPMPRGYEHFK